MFDKIEIGQVWRKQGIDDWIRIVRPLDPDYPDYDGGLHGCIIIAYPPQYSGIQLRGGKRLFLRDTDEYTWEEQIYLDRYLLKDGWKRGDTAWDLKQ